MYKVTNEFLNAIAKTDRICTIRGSITLKDTSTISLDDSNILSGSVSIDSQCVNSESFELGSVYSSQLSVTVTTDTDRYSLIDTKVFLEYGLMLEDGTFEYVPLGVFNVTEANRVYNNVSIKALDNLILLDKSFEQSSGGTVFDILSYISANTGVELSQTQDEILKLPNGDAQLYIPNDSKISTYRDLLSYVSQILGGFATADRLGKIKINKFDGISVQFINSDQIFSSEVSDFKVKYGGVKTVIDGKTYTSIIEGVDRELLELEENPLLIKGLDATKQQILDNIRDAISIIEYTPCTIDFAGNPALDLGDAVIIKCKSSKENINATITNSNFGYRTKHNLKSVGKNPYLKNALSKDEKRLNGLDSNTRRLENVTYKYTNISGFKIADKLVNVVRMEFGMTTDCIPIFMGQTCLEVTVAGVLNIEYRVNSNKTNYSGIQHLSEGFHTINFFYPISEGTTDALNSVDVNLSGLGGLRCNIAKDGIVACVTGNGLSKAGEWNGTISAMDDMRLLAINPIKLLNMNDVMSINTQFPMRENKIETFNKIKASSGLKLLQFNEELNIEQK